MKFNEKLQELRKNKGLTQEELAELLYVSRTAVSKWESGRGYPNIDSLKSIAKIFSITIDELLSSDELLTIAEDDNAKKCTHLYDLVFGLLDISVSILLFFPFFGQREGEHIKALSLLSLTDLSPYLMAAYFGAVISIAIFGIITLAMQNFEHKFWASLKEKLSLLLNLIGAGLFVVSLQPYAAIFMLLILTIKVLMLLKRR